MFDESYREAIKRTLMYIENHADEKLCLETLARVARISPFHFHRIFTSYMGVSLGQYIKVKRLELGMQQIAHSDRKIIDIALSSGYESPTAFNKAFRKEIGMSPTSLRKDLKDKKDNYMSHFKHEAVPFLGFQDLQPTPILYVRKTGNYHNSASAAWEEMFTQVAKSGLSISDPNFIGQAHDNPHAEDVNEQDIRFDACIVKREGMEGLQELGLQEGSVDGGRYAVFLHKGPYETLGDSYHFIYGQWMYNEDQKFRDAPTFVRYRNITKYKEIEPKDIETEIFIPVK